MNVAHLILCRDKEKWVERAMRSVFEQTFSPLTMIFSVQESKDRTAEIVQQVADSYRGPNKVLVVQCPNGEYRGMPGAIANLNFALGQIDADIIIDCSADDYNEPTRVEKIVKIFETYNPSYVGTRVQYETPEGTKVFQTDFPDRSSRHISTAELIKFQIGSSSSTAFAHDLWRKYGPFRGLESPDVMMPVMATLERGYYFIDEILHHHVFHADVENMGMEGQLRGAEQQGVAEAILQTLENNNFHCAYNWINIYQRLTQSGLAARLSQDAIAALYEKVIGNAHCFVTAREELTLKRIAPMPMRV